MSAWLKILESRSINDSKSYFLVLDCQTITSDVGLNYTEILDVIRVHLIAFRQKQIRK